MKQTHEIKLDEKFADAVLSGDKCFEVRYNDRGYQKGDLVKFKVVDGAELIGRRINHTLNDKKFEITYVLNGWGIKEDYVVFGIKMIEE